MLTGGGLEATYSDVPDSVPRPTVVMTREQLADATGISLSTLYRYLKKLKQIPSNRPLAPRAVALFNYIYEFEITGPKTPESGS
ncbi:MAG TPA: hypothetical protein DCE41_04695 [Cytophagales bacterium]|nr:hypothetical protein [Cytophagales bacterium]HAA21845.1 hypothetical protein [Cytophagales bacterium]HAP64296.1 hypothetical protein [Cytophagales bacterium]